MDKFVSLFGLFVYGSNVSVPLTGVHYEVNVNSFASQITINQTYRNKEVTDIECVYGFPINDYASVTGFVVSIDDRILSSQFKKKDEAFKEYSDAIKRGDGAYLLDQSDRSDDTFIFSVGRLPPKKECTVSISYVATLEFPTEKTLRLVVPTSLSPRYNPDKAKIRFQESLVHQHVPNDRTKDGVNPPEVYQPTVSYKATLNADIRMFNAIEKVSSPSHPVAVSIQDANHMIVSFGAQKQPLERDLVLEVDVKAVPQHHVEVEQTGPNEFAAMYSFVPKFDFGKDGLKAELIFVLDCSGSMDEDDKIGEARRALKIFLRSIPEGSYFNFYRFGSNFQSLFEESNLYNAESFARAEVYAEQSSANMGGTEMLAPLKKIYESSPRAGFARQLFVLTDGEITNTNEVIDLVRRNAFNTRVFSFGLGKSPSRTLVNGIALAGSGRSEFIVQGEVLESKIGHQLSHALQPAVVDAAISWENLGTVQLQVPSVMPPVYRGERQLAFAIFKQPTDSQLSSNKVVVLKVSSGRFETRFAVPEKNATGPYKQTILKLAARAMVKDLETRPTAKQMQGSSGSLQQSSPEDPSKGTVAEKVTEISLIYGVLSKYVSLVAVEHRENATAGPMKLREIPVQKISPTRTLSRYPVRFHNFKMNIAKGFGRHRPMGFGASSNLFSKAAPEDYAIAPQQPKAEVTAAASLLSDLLNKQLWDGSWKSDQQIEKMTGVTLNQLSNGTDLKLDEDVKTTLLVVEFIKEKYPKESNVWKLLVDKAWVFLKKRVASAAELEEAALAAKNWIVRSGVVSG